MADQTSAVGMERKLAAIFSTDVAGYSRLMGDDEEATIRTLTAYRTVISSLIHHHRGRVVDSPGDNLLAEFASVVDAVRCAVEIQHELKTKNAELPENRRMQFRIGINLGDVIIEGERLYGDGVNIAARLESLAIPGGICISGTVYDQVETKLALKYEYQGEQTVKNIVKPVRVYRVGLEVPSPLTGEGQGEGVVDGVESQKAKGKGQKPVLSIVEGAKVERQSRRVRPVHLIFAGLVLIAGVVAIVLYVPLSSFRTPHSPIRNQEAQPPSLPLPDKPSIVVLPFVNMSNDPAQEYFSDGMTEELTATLAKLSSLFVIARNSAFTYKGKAVKVQDVGHELGVRYVVEGSVRKADNRVRVTAQLIDATTGGHLWAQTYDREIQDIFAVQDEVTQKIMFALKVTLTPEEQARFRRTSTHDLEAYDYCLRGKEHYLRFTKEAHVQARQLLEKAITIDPKYAEAYASLALIHWQAWVWQWNQDPRGLDWAFASAQRAVTLNDSLAIAHALLGHFYLFKKQHDQAIAEGEKAILLDPNDAESYAWLGQILNYSGRPEETVGLIEKAMRLNPHYPEYYPSILGYAYRLLGQYQEAIAAQKSALARNPDFLAGHSVLAVLYSELGREKEAQAEVAEVLRISPQFSLKAYGQKLPFKNPVDLERYLAALRKAGLK